MGAKRKKTAYMSEAIKPRRRPHQNGTIHKRRRETFYEETRKGVKRFFPRSGIKDK